MKKINSVEGENDFKLLFITIPIVILVLICSSIGIGYPGLYSKETTDWMCQTIGQDFSNLFVGVPTLLISAFIASKGSKIGKVIWIGTMITNIYSYVIYCFAVHFNFLFHVYCLILGLSIYSVIYFFAKNKNVNFKSWFTEGTSTKPIGISLCIIALLFTFLWLSDSLPAALNNAVPESIAKDGLLVNPVQVLDFSIYLPLMFISSLKVIRKETEGYLLAQMMMIFAILTNINIISLMIVSMQKEAVNNGHLIVVFTIFLLFCMGILYQFIKNISKSDHAKYLR